MIAAAWECGEIERCAKGSTRVECMRKAAWWRHDAADAVSVEPEFSLRWAATWRAAGKAIPRRIGMVCARARREHRRGFRLRARDTVAA